MIDTINTICKEIAPELGLNEALVKKAYAHYWKAVKKSVASGKHTSIWLKYLGTLAVSRTKNNKQIMKLIRRARLLRDDKIPRIRKTKEQMMLEIISELHILCARRNDLAKVYNTNLKNIRARHAAKTQGHMGESALDPTGSGEQIILSEQTVGTGAP
jgi:nucleoid DNA-binding protein